MDHDVTFLLIGRICHIEDILLFLIVLLLDPLEVSLFLILEYVRRNDRISRIIEISIYLDIIILAGSPRVMNDRGPGPMI